MVMYTKSGDSTFISSLVMAWLYSKKKKKKMDNRGSHRPMHAPTRELLMQIRKTFHVPRERGFISVHPIIIRGTLT